MKWLVQFVLGDALAQLTYIVTCTKFPEFAPARTQPHAHRALPQQMAVERLLDVGHRVMVSALVITSLSGLTYIGAAAVDVYGRARKHKQLQQQQQQQQN